MFRKDLCDGGAVIGVDSVVGVSETMVGGCIEDGVRNPKMSHTSRLRQHHYTTCRLTFIHDPMQSQCSRLLILFFWSRRLS